MKKQWKIKYNLNLFFKSKFPVVRTVKLKIELSKEETT